MEDMNIPPSKLSPRFMRPETWAGFRGRSCGRLTNDWGLARMHHAHWWL